MMLCDGAEPLAIPQARASTAVHVIYMYAVGTVDPTASDRHGRVVKFSGVTHMDMLTVTAAESGPGVIHLTAEN